MPEGTPMSMPGWQASHARRSQNGEVIGPLTGQISWPEPCLTGPADYAEWPCPILRQERQCPHGASGAAHRSQSPRFSIPRQ